MAKKRKKKNKKFIIILLIIILSIILLIYNKDLNYNNVINIKIGDELPTIEKYINDKDLKRLKNKNIEWENIPLEDNKIYYSGKYIGYIYFKNEKIKINLEVIDNQNPTIEGVEDITIYQNTEIDLLKNIKISDNSHDEVSIKIKGEYDISKIGEYYLSYVATDKSKNETTKKFKLIVKEKQSNNQNGTIIAGTTTKGYTIKKINGIYYINNILIANKTYDLPNNYAPGGLLNDFMNAFNNMQKEAANQGINLTIVSGYRSYSTQYNLYNRYVNKDGKVLADTYSARAGHSEHQSGLAADVNSLDQTFISTKDGEWLNNNCQKYGFIIRYPKGKEKITGYMYEPWHIRYVGVDIATQLYNNGEWLSLEEYLGITSEYSY